MSDLKHMTAEELRREINQLERWCTDRRREADDLDRKADNLRRAADENEASATLLFHRAHCMQNRLDWARKYYADKGGNSGTVAPIPHRPFAPRRVELVKLAEANRRAEKLHRRAQRAEGRLQSILYLARSATDAKNPSFWRHAKLLASAIRRVLQ